nr:MAG TPA: hypothetical protein [Caudoviricetes sp.]
MRLEMQCPPPFPCVSSIALASLKHRLSIGQAI